MCIRDRPCRANIIQAEHSCLDRFNVASCSLYAGIRSHVLRSCDVKFESRNVDTKLGCVLQLLGRVPSPC
eukprot:5103067-Amphidinium_carterae.1